MAKTTSRVKVFAFCIVCLLVFSTYRTSHADVTGTVKVETVYMVTPGTTHTGCMVVLRNTTGAAIGAWPNATTRAFYLAKILGNQGMAVFLTALSNKTKVAVSIAGTATQGSLINYVGVTQTAQ